MSLLSVRWSPQLRSLWEQRFPVRARVPKSISVGCIGEPLQPHEHACVTLRGRFRKYCRKWLEVIALRDGRRCAACGIEERLVLDHIIPICWGGTNDLFNLRILCSPCNSQKAGDLPIAPRARRR